MRKVRCGDDSDRAREPYVDMSAAWMASVGYRYQAWRKATQNQRHRPGGANRAMRIDPVKEMHEGAKAMHEAAAEIRRLRAENERLNRLIDAKHGQGFAETLNEDRLALMDARREIERLRKAIEEALSTWGLDAMIKLEEALHQ